jgi:hypothetical protein
MSSNLDSILEDCLEHIAQGETLQACLSRYPEQAAALEPLLVAAGRLEEEGARVRPSAAFKARTRSRLYAHMDAHPRQRRQFGLPHFSPMLRLMSALAAVLIACTVTGTALAQSALPGDLLYTWKLTSEQAWRSISPDPVGVDLARGDRRIDEAVAVSANADAQGIALHAYQSIVTDLEKYEDLSVRERISTGLKTQQDKLKNSGLELPAVELPDSGVKNPSDLIP